MVMIDPLTCWVWWWLGRVEQGVIRGGAGGPRRPGAAGGRGRGNLPDPWGPGGRPADNQAANLCDFLALQLYCSSALQT
jgi:hypothetical protein